MPSGYATVGFPEDQIFFVTPHRSSPDAICPLVVKGVSDQTEVSASDRHPFPLVTIHVFRGTLALRNRCICPCLPWLVLRYSGDPFVLVCHRCIHGRFCRDPEQLGVGELILYAVPYFPRFESA